MGKTYIPQFDFRQFLEEDEVQNRIAIARKLAIRAFKDARDPQDRRHRTINRIIGCDLRYKSNGKVKIDSLARWIVAHTSAFMMGEIFTREDLDRNTLKRYSPKEQQLIITEMQVQAIIKVLVQLRDNFDIYVIDGEWEILVSVVDELVKERPHPTRIKWDDHSYHGRPKRDRERQRAVKRELATA